MKLQQGWPNSHEKGEYDVRVKSVVCSMATSLIELPPIWLWWSLLQIIENYHEHPYSLLWHLHWPISSGSRRNWNNLAWIICIPVPVSCVLLSSHELPHSLRRRHSQPARHWPSDPHRWTRSEWIYLRTLRCYWLPCYNRTRWLARMSLGDRGLVNFGQSINKQREPVDRNKSDTDGSRFLVLPPVST